MPLGGKSYASGGASQPRLVWFGGSHCLTIVQPKQRACPAATRYGTSASCITYADQRGCVIVYVFSFVVMLIALQRSFGLHWISE